MLKDNIEQYFEIKTVKPNIDVFEKSKTKLLEWVVRKRSPINVFLAISYNPYEPEPYQRWTLQGLFDLENEIMVAEEFWNFLGGENTYEQLLSVFETVGIELRSEIDDRFQTFNK